MSRRMMILRAGEDAPALRFPVIGNWYSGQSERGTGAIAKYQGWNVFELGDETEVDMTIYDHLVEHQPRA